MTAHPTSPDVEAEQRAALRRFRAGATAVLLVMAAVFAATHFLHADGFWLELVRAASEAALVGGLADWFAVTALFRHPLGLPIPHTAVIPRSQERIAEGLGRFVERNFLDPDLLAERLHSLDPAQRIAAGLSDPVRAHALAGAVLEAVPFALDSARDEQVRRFVQRALSRQLRDAELAPALARAIAVLRESDQHHRVFDQALIVARETLLEHQDRIYDAVGERSRWWVPRSVDRRMARSLVEGVGELLAELADPEHPVRHRFAAALDDLAERLRHDPALRAQVRDIQHELLSSPRVQGYLGSLWDALRETVAADVAAPRSALRQGAARGLAALGTALADDPAMRARVNGWAEAMVRRYIVPFRAEIGAFIRDVVRRWDARTMTDRLELAVGRDLQYIRINGTLVGALVGAALFLITYDWPA